MQTPANPDATAFMDLLSPRQTAEIAKAATLQRYNDGRLIHSRGDDKPGLSIVKSGAAHAGVYGADGSFVMTSILGPGQTFGEFTLYADLPRTHDISAIGPTEIYQIAGAKFAKLTARDPEIAIALLKASLTRLHIVLEMLDAIRRLPLRERTAKILLSVMRTAGDRHAFACRQSDLAFTIGVSRVSLGKALKELAALGLIELGYGEIRLPNRRKLTDWVARHCDVALGA